MLPFANHPHNQSIDAQTYADYAYYRAYESDYIKSGSYERLFIIRRKSGFLLEYESRSERRASQRQQGEPRQKAPERNIEKRAFKRKPDSDNYKAYNHNYRGQAVYKQYFLFRESTTGLLLSIILFIHSNFHIQASSDVIAKTILHYILLYKESPAGNFPASTEENPHGTSMTGLKGRGYLSFNRLGTPHICFKLALIDFVFSTSLIADKHGKTVV